MTRTLTAFFDSRSDAMSAADELAAAGISRGSIRILPEADVASDSSNTQSSYDTEKDEKGFWESLGDLFFPNEDRYSYAEAMNRGSIMVTATVDDSMVDRAEDILEEYGTVNMEEREESWRKEGWTGWTGSEASTRYSSSEGFAEQGFSEDASGTIPLAEEELRIGKREVNRGRVRVRSYVVEEPVSEDVNLREETVHVERRPVDRNITASDADDLFRERTIEVEERGEEAVVSKTARVREEVAIGKDVEERTETVSDKVRRTEVEVDDDRSSGTGKSRRSKK
jgi:uncharacterized protein (TIGR02271 family)